MINSPAEIWVETDDLGYVIVRAPYNAALVARMRSRNGWWNRDLSIWKINGAAEDDVWRDVIETLGPEAVSSELFSTVTRLEFVRAAIEKRYDSIIEDYHLMPFEPPVQEAPQDA